MPTDSRCSPFGAAERGREAAAARRRSQGRDFPAQEKGHALPPRYVRADIIEYIQMFYNSTRLHSYLGYRSPNGYEAGEFQASQARR
jgi:transposase InsO family protein